MLGDRETGWADEAELAFLRDILGAQDDNSVATAQRWQSSSKDSLATDPRDPSSSGACNAHAHPDDPTHTPAPPTTAKKTPKFASTRARQLHQKRELETLIRNLEATISQLQTTKGQSSPQVPQLTLAPHNSDTKTSSEMSYAHLVETERALLTHAQRANKQLRRSLVRQKKLARSLQQVLLARVSSAALVREQLGLRHCRPERLGLATNDFAVFQTMVLEINRMYARIPSHLHKLEHATQTSGSYRRWHIHKDAALDAVTLHVAACDELPFERAAVDAAMTAIRQSNATPGYRRLDARLFGAVSADTRLTEEVTTVSSPVASGAFRHRHVSRVWGDATRSVTLMVVYVDSVDGSGTALPGFRFRIEVWIVRTQVQDVSAGTGRVQLLTRLETISTVTPVAVGSPQAMVWNEQFIEAVVIPLWDREGTAKTQMVENWLLDQQVARKA